jgi:hypothetical protein
MTSAFLAISIAEEIEHTHILLSTAIDNEEMILIYNNRKILIHFFPTSSKRNQKNSIKRIRIWL